MIFDRSRGKAKRDEDADKGLSNRLNKKKNQRGHGGSLVATAKRKAGRASTKGTPDHFDKLLEGPCPNHTFPVKHLYKDCALMKHFLSGGSKKGDQRKKLEPATDAAEGKDGGFPTPDGCLMIFGRAVAYGRSNHPSFLRWSESVITFDRSDHLENVP